MQGKRNDLLIFHLTGRCSGDALQPVAGSALLPALLAPYRDLDALRHDFPAVLAEDDAAGADFVRPLPALVDAVLADVAPRGVEGERLRRHALQLEREIRTAVAGRGQATLSQLWQAAAVRVGGRNSEGAEPVLTQAGTALDDGGGAVLGCTPDMPAALLTRAWRNACRAKARVFRADAARLVGELSDILRAAHARSAQARQPQALRAAVGGPHRDAFDFDAWSRIVGRGALPQDLPPARRERLERVLATIEGQRFHLADEADDDGAYRYAYDDSAAAAAAYTERLPALAELVKAMAIAELEVRGRYVESEHDLFFGAFDERMLTPADLARFPDYLVCIPPGRNDAPENATLLESLSAGLPLKVLVQTTSLHDESAIGTGRHAWGVRSARLATAAMGLGGMFVLQSPASHLVALRKHVARGMACSGPALFSVYTASEGNGALPPYLGAAAALQSRAFPAFCYDAAAGSNWAGRFSLVANPQPDADWPVEALEYADGRLQRVRESCAYTYADCMLADPRHAAHYARLATAAWGDAQLLPAADWLRLPDAEAGSRVPWLWAVDANDRLQRVLVDRRMMDATRRCLLLWRRLQEHAGIHDSHAERLLAREKAAWEAAAAASAPASASATPAPTQAAAAASASASAAPGPGAAKAAAAESAATHEAPPGRSRDDAWIDTARCPSCNECQVVNDRMFAYDERKQAYIKDITAGTYRHLVEAAEGCQVAIIHPGKPLDPDEPGLEELLLRAEPFR